MSMSKEERRRRRGRPRCRFPGAIPRVLLTVGVLLAGCRGSDATAEGEAAMTTTEFVEIVTALREAEREVAQEDSAESRYLDRKAEILARYEATGSDLRAFVERLQGDPVQLQSVWDTISQRLKHVPGGGEAAEGEGELKDDGDPPLPSAAPGRRPIPPRMLPGGPPGEPGERPLPESPDTGEQRLH